MRRLSQDRFGLKALRDDLALIAIESVAADQIDLPKIVAGFIKGGAGDKFVLLFVPVGFGAGEKPGRMIEQGKKIELMKSRFAG